MRIAAAQVEARWGDIEGNIDRHLQMGRWAFSGGVNLLLFAGQRASDGTPGHQTTAFSRVSGAL